MSRLLSRSALALVAVLTVACGGPETPVVSFERHLGLLRAGLATDTIWRRDPDSLRALGRGWDVDVDSDFVEGMWAIGKEAELHLFTAQPGDHQLVFEAVPPEGAAAQGVTARLNGERLPTALSLRPGWNRYELELPDALMHIGDNHVELSFSTPLRPSDLDPNNGDDRLLAARFRFLRLVPPVPHPAPAGLSEQEAAPLPTSATTPGPATSGAPWHPRMLEQPDGTTAMELRADSLVQFAVDLPVAARLVGRATAAPANDSSGGLDWSVELIAADGSVHEIAAGPRMGWFGNSLTADLGAWGGQTVAVRIRTWGPARGAVLWTGLGFTGDFDSRQFDPARLPITEASGRLGKPDAVFILLDAARADAFSAFRGATATPNVDALAAAGTRFDNAYAAAPWTGQSVYSIFTGRYPEAHGVVAWKDQLPSEISTLFQLTYAAGYHTYLWTEHPMYRGTRSLRYDVDTIVDIRPRQRINRRELLPKATGEEPMFVADKPTFAFVHLVPPHAPYNPPAPYGGSLRDKFAATMSLQMDNLDAWSHSLGSGAPTSEQIRYVWSAYLENVQYADELMGRVVAEIKAADRYDDAMIVLLADHGEAFFEHGHFLHTWPMYDELLRVPLVIKWPRNATGFARAIEQPTTLVDLAPTLMDAIGVDGEGNGFQGVSLLPMTFDGYSPQRDIYAHTAGVSVTMRGDLPEKPMSVLIHDGMKVIWDHNLGRLELYDLHDDPGEAHDLAHERPQLAQRLLQRLLLQQQANLLVFGALEVTPDEGDLDPETIDRLRALGYIR